MAKLTKSQNNALLKLSPNPASSYSIKTSLATLYALEKRDLVRASYGIGSIVFPTTAITWRITDLGRAALAKNVEG